MPKLRRHYKWPYKLYPFEVANIRFAWERQDYNQYELARIYDVTQTNISYIVNFITWREL